jgi:outer membrane protein TolC
VYYNALAKEYAVRLQNAERIAATYKTKLDKGDANILEHNKAQLNLATMQTETAQIEAERTALLSELKRLNGGKEFVNYELRITNYEEDKSDIRNSQFVIRNFPLLPVDFEDWYKAAELKSPVLQYISGEIEINRQQIKLSQALGLPKFSAGYMSEKIVGEHFQGVTVGVSIPLWENKNRVKEAKAQVRTSESALEDSKVQFYNRLQSLHLKASSLQRNAQKLRQSLSAHSNEPLLKKALDAGEISLLTYLLEIEYYYEAVNKVLETEKDYQKVFAELSAVEL